ncbi:hypothetical protein IAT38_008317 [Cryptococcus sp. DSM 104549]
MPSTTAHPGVSSMAPTAPTNHLASPPPPSLSSTISSDTSPPLSAPATPPPATPSPTPPPVTLHLILPHILSVCPPRTILTLSLTSKAIRFHAMPYFYTHLHLSEGQFLFLAKQALWARPRPSARQRQRRWGGLWVPRTGRRVAAWCRFTRTISVNVPDGARSPILPFLFDGGAGGGRRAESFVDSWPALLPFLRAARDRQGMEAGYVALFQNLMSLELRGDPSPGAECVSQQGNGWDINGSGVGGGGEGEEEEPPSETTEDTVRAFMEACFLLCRPQALQILVVQQVLPLTQPLALPTGPTSHGIATDSATTIPPSSAAISPAGPITRCSKHVLCLPTEDRRSYRSVMRVVGSCLRAEGVVVSGQEGVAGVMGRACMCRVLDVRWSWNEAGNAEQGGEGRVVWWETRLKGPPQLKIDTLLRRGGRARRPAPMTIVDEDGRVALISEGWQI